MTVPNLGATSENEKGGCCGGSGSCGKDVDGKDEREGCCGGSGDCGQTEGGSSCGSGGAVEKTIAVEEGGEVADAEHHVALMVERYKDEVYGLLKALGWEL